MVLYSVEYVQHNNGFELRKLMKLLIDIINGSEFIIIKIKTSVYRTFKECLYVIIWWKYISTISSYVFKKTSYTVPNDINYP